MTPARLVVGVALLLPLVGMFWQVLFLPRTFAFRDAANFYFPLFRYVQQELSAGRFPLWNPYESSGVPLFANSTSSVLYPGKLLFFLPLPYHVSFNLYAVGHILLAGALMYRLARRWGGGAEAAGLAAVSYAYSGSVMFQHTNVVFLCGAAWLPAALEAGDLLHRRRRFRQSAVLGVILALMVLAGDAQMAYHTGLLLGLYAVLLWLRRRRWMRSRSDRLKHRTAGPQKSSLTAGVSSFLRNRLLLLGVAAACGFLLAAVQILPTSELRGVSSRGVSVVPRSLFEIPGFISRDIALLPRQDSGQPPHWYDTLIGDPPPPTRHYYHTYRFSHPPWRTIEFFWPDFSGATFEPRPRWLFLMGGDSYVWVPSIYMGLLPALLALMTWTIRKGQVRVRWLSWVVLLSLVASYGTFGPVWLVRQVAQWLGLVEFSGEMPGGEVGGLYWLMVVCLPGYADFRFPAKLLVVTAAGVSLLAAHGWQRHVVTDSTRLRQWLKRIVGAGVAAVVLVVAIRPVWDALLRKGVPGEVLPPEDFDSLALWYDLARGGVHLLLTSAALLLWHRYAWRTKNLIQTPHSPRERGMSEGILSNDPSPPAPLPGGEGGLETAARQAGGSAPAFRPFFSCGTVALLLTALDIAIANGRMVSTIPAADLLAESSVAAVIRKAEEIRSGTNADQAQPFRIYRPPDWMPDSGYEERLLQRQIMHSQNLLLERLSSVSDRGTLNINDYQTYFEVFELPDGLGYLQPRRSIDAWGARYLVLPRHGDVRKNETTPLGVLTKWREPQWSATNPQLIPAGPPLEPALDDADAMLGRFADQIQILYNESHFPRAWVVHEIEPVPPVSSRDHVAWMPPMQSIVHPLDRWRDLRRMAVVEDESLARLAQGGVLGTSSRKPGIERCDIVIDRAGHVEIEAVLTSLGLVVVADPYYPGWELTVSTNGGPPQRAPILRANFAMRGVMLTPGRHRLVFRYNPSSFRTGAMLSLMAWISLAVWTIHSRGSFNTSHLPPGAGPGVTVFRDVGPHPNPSPKGRGAFEPVRPCRLSPTVVTYFAFSVSLPSSNQPPLDGFQYSANSSCLVRDVAASDESLSSSEISSAGALPASCIRTVARLIALSPLISSSTRAVVATDIEFSSPAAPRDFRAFSNHSRDSSDVPEATI